MEGFIIDAPNVLIEGKNHTYATITAGSGSVQFTGQSLTINGGWSPYALIDIPTTTEIAVSLSDAKLTDGYLEVGFGADHQKNQTVERTFFGNAYEIDETGVMTIDKKIVAGSFRVNGMTETTGEVTENTFKVTIADASTTIQFHTGMADTEIVPMFKVEETAEVYSVTQDSIPEKGRATLEFPVYSNEEDDASVVAYCQLTIYSVSVTQNATFGGSYKTPSTFGLELKGTDPKRADKKIWDVAFFVNE